MTESYGEPIRFSVKVIEETEAIKTFRERVPHSLTLRYLTPSVYTPYIITP